MSEPKGWNAEKQARYEAFMQSEKEAEQAEADRLEAERTGSDLALDTSVPDGEAPAPDEWEETLAKIETMPDVPGSLARTSVHVKASTAFLLKQVGINQKKPDQIHTARLARVMESLGWEKPPNLWMGDGAIKGYRKEV